MVDLFARSGSVSGFASWTGVVEVVGAVAVAGSRPGFARALWLGAHYRRRGNPCVRPAHHPVPAIVLGVLNALLSTCGAMNRALLHRVKKLSFEAQRQPNLKEMKMKTDACSRVRIALKRIPGRCSALAWTLTGALPGWSVRAILVNGSTVRFLDYFDADPATAPKFAFHPHSGIATLRHSGRAGLLQGTTSAKVIETGVSSGCAPAVAFGQRRNARHQADHRGFQLWVAMPPSSTCEPQSHTWRVRLPVLPVLRGLSQANTTVVKSIVASPPGITYSSAPQGRRALDLPADQGHDVAWIASHQGIGNAGAVSTDEVVVFEAGDQAIEFEALLDAGFILGSAVKHPTNSDRHYSVLPTRIRCALREHIAISPAATQSVVSWHAAGR